MVGRYKDKMILGDKAIYSMDCHETGLNNNVMVVGAAGTGKTRSIVIPNLVNAEGSYIMCDPKGVLYGKYADILRKQGYQVHRISFIHPELSGHYNPLGGITSEQDIMKIAHMLIYSKGEGGSHADPFWNQAAELLLSSIIAFLYEGSKSSERNLKTVNKIIRCMAQNVDSVGTTVLDKMYDDLNKRKNGKSFAYRQYKQVMASADKTMRSILISTSATLAKMDTEALHQMMCCDDIDEEELVEGKTCIFVEVSDSDRSMDILANIFFYQMMQRLVTYADDKCGGELPQRVVFIIDDFATNVTIADFPRMISSFRSRKISTMLMIQSESQLKSAYGVDADTIISNCDTYIYMGSQDLAMAESIARRADKELSEILYMDMGKEWIFRRGQRPVYTDRYDLEQLITKER